MKLNATQIAEFDKQGYLFFPGLLNNDEVAILQKSIPEILDRNGPEVVCEKDDPESVRLAFGAHMYCESFRCLSLLPRLLNPVRQLVRDDVYLHQSRINPKNGCQEVINPSVCRLLLAFGDPVCGEYGRR